MMQNVCICLVALAVLSLSAQSQQLRRAATQNKGRLLLNEPCIHGVLPAHTAPGTPIASDETTDGRIFGDIFGSSSDDSGKGKGGKGKGSSSKGKGGKSGKGSSSGKGGSSGEGGEARMRQRRSRTVGTDEGKDSEHRLTSQTVAAAQIDALAPETGGRVTESAVLCADVSEEEPVFTEQSKREPTPAPFSFPSIDPPSFLRPLYPEPPTSPPVVLPALLPGPSEVIPAPETAAGEPVPAPPLGSEAILPPGPSEMIPVSTVPAPPSDIETQPPSGETVLPPGPSEFVPATPTADTSSTVSNPVTNPLPSPVSGRGDIPDGCTDALVYCPGRSSCYVDEAGISPGWGFSIDLNFGSDLTILEDCEIWAGVDGCSLSTGKKIGFATISKNMFHYCLDPGEYEADSFFLYAGQCMANDGGAHTVNGGVCLDEEIELNADNMNSFPLIQQGGNVTDLFTFDYTNPVNWAGYQVFPLGETHSRHAVAHVTACPVGTLAASGRNALPSPPEIAAGEPQGPQPLPPTPVVSPTQPPLVASPTQPPLVAPVAPLPSVAEQVDGVTGQVPDAVRVAALSCQDAWVYCPGRSTCLNDPKFNDGVLSAIGPTGDHDIWGWSISYDPEEDLHIEDCSILIGGTDCDVNTAVQVGTFSIKRDFGHFCFDEHGYAASFMAFYGGECKGNDGGFAARSNGQCDATAISQNAAKPQSYPIFRFDEELTINYTVDLWNSVNTPLWPEDHSVFPLEKNYSFSAYACVVPVDGSAVQADAQWEWGETATGESDSLVWDKEEAN